MKKNKNYDIIKKEFDEEWSENGLDTCSRVNNAIYERHKDEMGIQHNSAYNYTLAVKSELYGKSNDIAVRGTNGTCYSVICKQLDNDKFERFTEAEEAIYKELKTVYFGDAFEKEALVKELVERGSLREEDAWGYLQEIQDFDNNFVGLMTELSEKIGSRVARATMIVRDNEVKLIADGDQE